MKVKHNPILWGDSRATLSRRRFGLARTVTHFWSGGWSVEGQRLSPAKWCIGGGGGRGEGLGRGAGRC